MSDLVFVGLGIVLVGFLVVSGPNSVLLVAASVAITVAMAALYRSSFLFWRSGSRRGCGRE